MTDSSNTESKHRTSKFILLLDKIAHVVITVGGIGTIAAVMTVCLFLVYVVWPMFAPTSSEMEHQLQVPTITKPKYASLDEDRRLIWTLSEHASMQIIDVASSTIISDENIFDEQPTAIMMSPIHNIIVAGFANGSVRIAKIEFLYEFLNKPEIETTFHDMKSGEVRRRGQGVVFKTPSRQWRQTKLTIDVGKSLKLKQDKPIKYVDFTMSTSGPVIATYDNEHRLQVHKIVEKRNLMTMTVKKKLASENIPFQFNEKNGAPEEIVLIGQGEYLLLLWDNAYSERYNLLDDEVFLADKSLLASNGKKISSVGRFLGRNTVLVGYEDGDCSAWFLTEPESAETKDGRVWREGHAFDGHGSAVVSIESSKRQRLALINYADNRAKLVHVSSERIIYDGVGIEQPICASIAPKDDGILLCGAQGLNMVAIDAEHPDVTVASLFLPVWYEGYEGPESVWQSSSASDDAEPKLGLWPLIFGTLKGTFYSLLFAVPIALAAAIYSSEFMSPESKKMIKPGIEMMASLPSVVLGFLGAMVLKIWLRESVLDVLAALFVIPLCVAGTAYLVQLLPREMMVKAMKMRLWIIAIPCLIIGWYASCLVATIAETVLFGGDFIAWLDGNGSSFGGTWYLCLPISIVIVLFSLGRWGKPYLIERLRGASIAQCALVDGVKFLLSIILTIVIAAVLAFFLELIGLQFRDAGNVMGRYDNNNALLVGFMMAFAIIPIIYTIADDALSTVPNHLRAASLGSGATPWQTAIRIVVPTAMSGLFSAVMVGLGRAIGETMIVLMIAGNTPILDLNVFNGFKTLSANIASELPESVVNSTHYRTLFLSALVLFVMTFVLNTFAEYVRARFRKKAVSL